MCNLQVGDKVAVRHAGSIVCEHNRLFTGVLNPNGLSTIKSFKFAKCGCVVAVFGPNKSALTIRLRKVQPDKPEAATDAEFLKLMGKAKAASRQLTKV